MATIVTTKLIVEELEQTHGPIDSIKVERERARNRSRDYVWIYSDTCKHSYITADTIRSLHCNLLETLHSLVTGFMGTKGPYDVNVRDFGNNFTLPSLKKLHIEIYEFDQLPYDQTYWRTYYTVTGENITTTSLTNIFIPSLESLFIKGLFFQEDFSFSTSFPKAYRMEKSMVFDHCIFHPCIIPHITSECLVLQHCYLVLGNGVDEYNLLHITFSNIDFLLHKCTFSSTLVEIDKKSFPTKMADLSRSQEYLLRHQSVGEIMDAIIRRQREEREQQERQQIG